MHTKSQSVERALFKKSDLSSRNSRNNNSKHEIGRMPSDNQVIETAMNKVNLKSKSMYKHQPSSMNSNP